MNGTQMSIWKFLIAILFLWVIMEYVPFGPEIGIAVLLVTLVSTPAAVSNATGLIYTITEIK